MSAGLLGQANPIAPRRLGQRDVRRYKPIQTDLQTSSDATCILTEPGEGYGPDTRRWQGIPTIACARGGRLWASWYSGGEGEGNDNYAVLATSDDGGQRWRDPVALIDPPGKIRAWDPCLWFDPRGRLWWTWTQSKPEPGDVWDGRGGVWAVVSESPESGLPNWSAPRRLGDGIALNKPVFASNGEWLLPVTLWPDSHGHAPLDPIRSPGLLVSRDAGRTWTRRGMIEVADRVFDEPTLVERNDGSLLCLLRVRHGLAWSESGDGGRTWAKAAPGPLPGPGSRLHVSRLASGRLLLIYHDGNLPGKRSHLTAMLSEDDGLTWPHRLLLDPRCKVSYPDAVQGPEGRIWITYDHNRYTDREILLQCVDEAQILAGDAKALPPPRIISRATGMLVPEKALVPGGGFEPPTKGL